MKKTVVSMVILALFFIAAVSCESSSSTTNSSYSSRSYSSDAYSISLPVSDNTTCRACGGRGYIMRNGIKETCVCGGSGKAVPFPESKK